MKTAPAKIRIVEDDEQVRAVFRELMKRYNCVIDEAKDGGEALDKASEHTDILILDLKLPVVSGFEVFKETCIRDPKARVIIVAGEVNEYVIDRIYSSGRIAFFARKPFDITTKFFSEILHLCGVQELPKEIAAGI